MFNKKTNSMKPLNDPFDRTMKIVKRKKKKLFEFEGRYDDIIDDSYLLMSSLFNGNKGIQKGNKKITF
jgi:hypothetical protein